MILLGTQVIIFCVWLHFFLNAVKSKNLSVSQTPSELRVLKGDIAQMNCSYSITDEEQLRITWKRNSAQPLCYHVENTFNSSSIRWCAERANITLDRSTNFSSLILYDLHVNDSDIYFCQAFIEIPPPIQTAKSTGTHLTVEARPKVHIRAETLPYPNEGVQLVCTSLEFYPDSIQVSWFKDGQLITNGTENGTLYCNSDGTFSITSFLNLSVFDWNEGGNYSCQVNHSTLSAPITERAPGSNQGPTGDKQSWIISTACSLIVLMMFLVVTVLCTCSISKKKASSSRTTATPESEQNARDPVWEQSTIDNHAIYSLLGQEHIYDI
uniref:immunoglobulin kappa light chain-like n=1 Tax=Pristiophorus japonicus TaxID=55135 RepID=UPI00398F1D86